MMHDPGDFSLAAQRACGRGVGFSNTIPLDQILHWFPRCCPHHRYGVVSRLWVSRSGSSVIFPVDVLGSAWGASTSATSSSVGTAYRTILPVDAVNTMFGSSANCTPSTQLVPRTGFWLEVHAHLIVLLVLLIIAKIVTPVQLKEGHITCSFCLVPIEWWLHSEE